MADAPGTNSDGGTGRRTRLFNEDMVVGYARWLVRRRWLVIAASLVLAVILASGVRFLGFSTDYRVFFSKENPQLTAFEELQNVYTKDDNILIVIKPDDGDIFSPAILSMVRDMTKESWRTPFSTRVDSVTNFQHSYAIGDELIVEDLVRKDNPLDGAAIARIREVALNDPLLARRVVSEDGTTTAIAITLMFPQADMMEVPEAMGWVRSMVSGYAEANPNLRFAITGNTALSNAFSELSQSDMSTLVPLMYGALLIAMVALLRSGSGTFATVIVIGLSAATAMGIGGWMGILLTPPSVTAPTIILTIAVADSIHILSTMFKEMRHGASKQDAIVEAMRINMDPVFLTSLTTAIGFLSLNFSDAPPFHDLGNLTAIGVMAAWFYSAFMLPALMAVLPVRTKARQDEAAATILERGMMGLAELVIRHRKPFLIGGLATVVVLGALIPRIHLNDQFINYFDRGVQFRDDTDFTMANLSGIYQFNYSLPAGTGGGVSDPDYLEHLDAFSNWYREQPGVVHVATLTDIMRRLNRNMHEDDPEWYVVPDDRELAAQYLLLFEMSLPYGLDLNNQINVDKSATRLIVSLENMSTQKLRETAAAARVWLRENFPSAAEAQPSGPVVMFAYISERNINSMLFGTVLAIFLISASLILALRDLKHGLISLIPNTMPAIMAFGVWSILVGEIGLAASIIGAASLGIIVDDTVHFLSKYLRARQEKGLSAPDAVRYAFETVGVALTVTSAVLIAGFAVLAFSDFLLNEVMGVMMALTIFCALAADFLVLPPLLMALDRRETKARPAGELETE
jgi:hypothetical protein